MPDDNTHMCTHKTNKKYIPCMNKINLNHQDVHTWKRKGFLPQMKHFCKPQNIGKTFVFSIMLHVFILPFGCDSRKNHRLKLNGLASLDSK